MDCAPLGIQRGFPAISPTPGASDRLGFVNLKGATAFIARRGTVVDRSASAVLVKLAATAADFVD
ncbi:MAG: hypothetical protein WCL39_16010 [Armatimonadota bacterium]